MVKNRATSPTTPSPATQQPAHPTIPSSHRPQRLADAEAGDVEAGLSRGLPAGRASVPRPAVVPARASTVCDPATRHRHCFLWGTRAVHDSDSTSLPEPHHGGRSTTGTRCRFPTQWDQLLRGRWVRGQGRPESACAMPRRSSRGGTQTEVTVTVGGACFGVRRLRCERGRL